MKKVLLKMGNIHEEKFIPSYYMDRYAVTNEQFSQFINETGYITDAEKYGWSFVFHLFVNKENEKDILGSPEQTPWWMAVQGASWKYPRGDSSFKSTESPCYSCVME